MEDKPIKRIIDVDTYKGPKWMCMYSFTVRHFPCGKYQIDYIDLVGRKPEITRREQYLRDSDMFRKSLTLCEVPYKIFVKFEQKINQ